MKYFEIQDHTGKKIGEKVYFNLPLALRSARRTATLRSGNPETRGCGTVRVMEIDSGAIYGGAKVIERIDH